jgi:hypothetical protein
MEGERFGMGPAIVLGQDLTEAAGPVGDGAVADLATVTGGWVTVTGKWREGDLLICIYDASPAGVIMPEIVPTPHSCGRKSKFSRHCWLTVSRAD